MSDGCSKSHLEMVRLIRFRTVSDKFLYMKGKRMEFLIDNITEIVKTQVSWLWGIFFFKGRFVFFQVYPRHQNAERAKIIDFLNFNNSNNSIYSV